MISWRFDQGRLDYFQFDEIRRIAKALCSVDGIIKPQVGQDFLRDALAHYSSRPFLPLDYTVWRNYKRVFACLMLCTELADKIVCTDVCRSLASDARPVDADDFLAHFTKRFYYPSPVFVGYDPDAPKVYPAVAVIKCLVSDYLLSGKPAISVTEIGERLIANNVTGLENLDQYQTFAPRSAPDDLRQIRELVKFISQFSFLKWRNPNLYLDVSGKDEALKIAAALEPTFAESDANPAVEILNLGSRLGAVEFGSISLSPSAHDDLEFTEGRKIRAIHFRTERSARLREFYFESRRPPYLCDMCKLNGSIRYPWVDYLLDISTVPLSTFEIRTN